MRLIVGLGNPGLDYDGTRHNVGWEVLDEFAAKFGAIPKRTEYQRLAKSKFDGLVIETMVGSEKVLLLKPTTYMNLSGRSVGAALGFYQLPAEQMIVVLDDLALPCGKIRLRASGSSGGHNGLKDIERVLGSEVYPRLRIGIDAPPPRIAGRDYVLGQFTSDQRPLVNASVEKSVEALTLWIENGLEKAMNRFNVKD